MGTGKEGGQMLRSFNADSQVGDQCQIVPHFKKGRNYLNNCSPISTAKALKHFF